MSSVAATRLRKGNLIKHNNELCRIVETQHVTPGNLRGFVRAKMRKVKDGTMFEHRFRSEDIVERAHLDEREMQYLYRDGDTFYFMDTATYEQTGLSEEALGDSMNFLLPEAMINVEFYEGAPVGIDPNAVGNALASQPGVVEVHDLHLWEVTTGFPALAAHVVVAPGDDCHGRRRELQTLLSERFGIEHVTLQVDHATDRAKLLQIERGSLGPA